MKELTKSAYFKDAKILCGLTEEEQVIRMVTYIDSPHDYMRYQKKGALVIVSGWSEYFETESKRSELLHNLRDLKVTGMAIYPADFPEGYPEDLLAVCEKLQLPVITLRDDQSTEDTIRFFSENVFIEAYDAFMYKDEIQDQFYRCYRENKLLCIGKKLTEMAGKKVYIQYYDEKYPAHNILLQSVVEKKEDWIMRSNMDSLQEQMKEFYHYQLDLGERSVKWFGFHELENKQLVKAFWIFNEDELDEQDLRLFYKAYKALYLEFEKKEYSFMRDSEKAITYLLTEMRPGHPKSPLYEGRGRVIWFSKSLTEKNYSPFYSLVKHCLGENRLALGNVLVSNYQEGLVLLLSDCQDLALVMRMLASLYEQGAYFFTGSEPLYVGLGSYVEETGLANSFQDAKLAVHWAEKRATLPCVAFEELGVLRYFGTLIGTREERRIMLEYISPIMDYDTQNGAQLLMTMDMYERSLWGYTEAAKALYVHLNTVKYRIHQVEEIIGREFSDSKNRLEMSMALDIYRFMQQGQVRVLD
jgi:hypothetical protein